MGIGTVDGILDSLWELQLFRGVEIVMGIGTV